VKQTTFLLTLILFCSLIYGQEKEYISINLSDDNFTELTTLIKEQTGITIFYNSELTSNIKVTLQKDSITIEDALFQVLQNTNIRLSKWHKHYVLMHNEILIDKLPFFSQKITDSLVENKKTLVTESEKRYMSGRESDAIKTIIVGTKNNPTKGIIRIGGKIQDLDTGEPIIGATIYIEETNTGAATDLNGYFTILLPSGSYNAKFSSLGYKTNKYKLKVYSNSTIKIELKSSSFTLQEAIIKGDRQMDIKQKDPGLEKLTAKSIKAIPMMMGERDILKVSEMLPGIVSVGEGSSGLNVRGGSSDQNAFYINKIPIYNTSHLFGFFPAFNSDIIKDFSIYKGHVPAEYGGRISSVFNITTRQGNRKKFSLHGGVNPISANVTLEGPIKQNKSSILLSARSSYSDWILSRIKDPTIRNSHANFNDIALGLNYDFDKTYISTFFYSSNDKFDLSDINSYSYSNNGASINLHHNFNNILRMNTSLVGSQYAFETIDKQEVSTAYKHNYKINHYELKNDFTQTIKNNNEVSFGFSGIYYQLDRGSVIPYGQQSLKLPINHGIEKGTEIAAYLSLNYDFTSWFNLNAGIRYSLFAPLGKQEVYIYDKNKAKDVNSIRDTLFFNNNEIIKWYKSPEFRFSLNFETDPYGSIKLAFNQMSQNLFMLNNTISIAPNSQWKIADYHIKPSKSNQLSLGVFRSFPDKKIEASFELFYKMTKDFTEFKDGADFLNTPKIETELLQGEQKAYGIEILLKKKSGIIDGWIAYTYSRSFVQVKSDNTSAQINNGEIYPSNHDIPHVVNTVINYNISKRVTLSSVITYQSGKPVTYPVSIYYLDNTPLIDYSERNKYRIPDYFRTDLSLTVEGNLKRNKLIHSSWMLSVYNLTGRKNAYSVYFISEDGYIKGYKYSVIGNPLITFTWLFKLGNYSSQ